MPSQVDLVVVYTEALAEVETVLNASYPDTVIFVDGSLDQDEIPLYDNNEIRPFFILWPRLLRRAPRGSGRSVAGTRYDSYIGGFDLAAVARNGTDSRAYAMYAGDTLVGLKPGGNGEITLGEPLWEGARAVRDSSALPSRFATTIRAEFRLSAQPAA